jgi:phage recombination protein Bet
MTTALAVREDQTEWNPAQLAALRSLGVERADRGTLDMFLAACQRTRLDPWLRQIYLNGRFDNRAGQMKWGIQSSIDGLRIVAQRSDQYEGQTKAEWFSLAENRWTDVWTESGPPFAARVGVWRTRFREPLYAVAHWSEYAVTGSGDFMWRKMPALMLSKVAEALALRKAFPQDLSGIYTADEMAQSGSQAPAPEAMDEAGRAALLEALLDTIETATTDEELRAVWHQAGEVGVLNEPLGVDGASVAELIKAQRASLVKQPEATEQAAEVVDAEVVDA